MGRVFIGSRKRLDPALGRVEGRDEGGVLGYEWVVPAQNRAEEESEAAELVSYLEDNNNETNYFTATLKLPTEEG